MGGVERIADVRGEAVWGGGMGGERRMKVFCKTSHVTIVTTH